MIYAVDFVHIICFCFFLFPLKAASAECAALNVFALFYNLK